MGKSTINGHVQLHSTWYVVTSHELKLMHFADFFSNPAEAQIDPKNDKIAEMKKDLRTVPRVCITSGYPVIINQLCWKIIHRIFIEFSYEFIVSHRFPWFFPYFPVILAAK